MARFRVYISDDQIKPRPGDSEGDAIKCANVEQRLVLTEVDEDEQSAPPPNSENSC